MTDDELRAFLSNLFSDMRADEVDAVTQDVLPFYQDVIGAGADEGASLVPSVDWDLVNQDVLQLARDRAQWFAENMVDASYSQLDSVVGDWIESGGTLQDLLDQVDESVWGGDRPDLAAITETTTLFAEGNLLAFRSSGVVDAYNVNTANDDKVCQVCLDASENGPYPIDDDEHKPAFHPGDRCWITPVVRGED